MKIKTTTNRFNPDPDTQYGKCSTCGIALQTESGADAHMGHTFKQALAAGEKRGHSVRILNPTRERRIQHEVSDIVAEAILDAVSKLEDLVYRNHITGAEAKAAIARYADFADEWEARS